jgi:hypothetical protein
MSKNASKIEELKAQIAKLEAQDAALAALAPDHRLAMTLHETLCQWNHTDGCGWFYEMRDGIDDWAGDAHGRYLSKAHRLIKFCDNHNIQPNTAIDLFNLLNK